MKILLVLLSAMWLYAQEPFSGAAAVDREMERAVQDGLIPGGVVLIGHNGHVAYQKAYGSRALIPHREPMTLDTIFDAASLTKVIATTPAIMRLFEQGQIRLNDPVTKYLPDFQGGHSDITIRNLMTHFSGLRPDLDLKPAWSGYQTGIQRALTDKPTGPPGVRFVYSDIDFILLGEIVHRLSGKTLDEYARENFYEPLGMHETMFLPPASLRPRIAPTEINPATGQPLRGEVHDDTARYMGGVAGHAGVFTTAADLAKFAQMMLDGGQGERRPPVQRRNGSEVHYARNPPPTSRFCAASVGISILPIRAIAANYFRSVPTATPATQARRSGLIRSASPT